MTTEGCQGSFRLSVKLASGECFASISVDSSSTGTQVKQILSKELPPDSSAKLSYNAVIIDDHVTMGELGCSDGAELSISLKCGVRPGTYTGHHNTGCSCCSGHRFMYTLSITEEATFGLTMDARVPGKCGGAWREEQGHGIMNDCNFEWEGASRWDLISVGQNVVMSDQNMSLILKLVDKSDDTEGWFAVSPESAASAKYWQLGLQKAYVGKHDAASTLRAALALSRAEGNRISPFTCLSAEFGNLDGLRKAVKEEKDVFVKFCKTSSALQDVTVKSSGAFSNVYQLGGDCSYPPGGLIGDSFHWILERQHTQDRWMIDWAMESVMIFGPEPDMNGGSYGETFFSSWLEVFNRPSVQTAVGRYDAPLQTRGTLLEGQLFRPCRVTILGSALGYQAMFFLAVGLRSANYDILSDSMVQKALSIQHHRDIFEQTGVTMEVGDARNVPLSASEGWPSLLWLNDKAWPRDLRVTLFLRAANELVPQSVIVCYGVAEGLPPESFQLVDSLKVRTTWNASETINILAKS